MGISWLVEWSWGSVGWKRKGFSRIGLEVSRMTVKVSGMDVDFSGIHVGADNSGICVPVSRMGVGVG